MTRVKMSSKNQIVIPREARERLGLRPGDRLVVSVEDGRIVLERTPEDPGEALRGLLRECYGDVDAYVARERGSWED